MRTAVVSTRAAVTMIENAVATIATGDRGQPHRRRTPQIDHSASLATHIMRIVPPRGPQERLPSDGVILGMQGTSIEMGMGSDASRIWRQVDLKTSNGSKRRHCRRSLS